MKKGIIVVAVILVILVIGGIFLLSNSNKESNTPISQNTEENKEAFYFETDGQEVKLGENFLELNLPEASNVYEAESCAFDGMEKTYTYDNFEIGTYPIDNNEKIVTIYIMNPEVTTKEGIQIGDTLEDLKEAYGEDYETADASYIYKKGKTTLTFVMNDNTISSIEYRLMAE